MGDAPFDVIFAVRRGGGATGMPMKSTIFREAATKEKKKKKTTTGRIHPSGVIRLPIPPAFASNPLKRSREFEASILSFYLSLSLYLYLPISISIFLSRILSLLFSLTSEAPNSHVLRFLRILPRIAWNADLPGKNFHRGAPATYESW